MRRRIYERRIDTFALQPDITAFGRIGKANGTSEPAPSDVPILFHIKFRVPVEHARPVLAGQHDFEQFVASSARRLEFCTVMG